jgi:hypothetical protein
MFAVEYVGKFAFVKNMNAQRCEYILSDYQLEPCTLAGISDRLGVPIAGYRLDFESIFEDQENVCSPIVVQKGVLKKPGKSIIKRGLLSNVVLKLLFEREVDAQVAMKNVVYLSAKNYMLMPDKLILVEDFSDYST